MICTSYTSGLLQVKLVENVSLLMPSKIGNMIYIMNHSDLTGHNLLRNNIGLFAHNAQIIHSTIMGSYFT